MLIVKNQKYTTTVIIGHFTGKVHFINLQISCFVKTDWLLCMTTQNKYMYKLYVFTRWVHFLPSLTVAWLLRCCMFAKTGKKMGWKMLLKKSWFKILVQNLYSKSWRKEKHTKTRLQSTQSENASEISWSSDHIFFPSPATLF